MCLSQFCKNELQAQYSFTYQAQYIAINTRYKPKATFMYWKVHATRNSESAWDSESQEQHSIGTENTAARLKRNNVSCESSNSHDQYEAASVTGCPGFVCAGISCVQQRYWKQRCNNNKNMPQWQTDHMYQHI